MPLPLKDRERLTTVTKGRDSARAECAELREQLAEARRCLRYVECSACGRLYDTEPLPDCHLADHIEAYAALFPKADVK